MSVVRLVNQASAPSTPAAGETRVFVDSATKQLASKDDAGAVSNYVTDGEANTAANVGGGAGVFRDKIGAALNFRSLVATSAAIVLTQAADTISVAFGHVLTAALDASNFAVTALKTATFNAEFDNGDSGAADTVDWTAAQKQRSTLTSNVTYTFTAPAGPCNVILRVIQDASGGRSITWPGSVQWPNGIAPAVTAGGANAVHLIAFYFDGTNYYGVGSLSFS